MYGFVIHRNSQSREQDDANFFLGIQNEKLMKFLYSTPTNDTDIEIFL